MTAGREAGETDAFLRSAMRKAMARLRAYRRARDPRRELELLSAAGKVLSSSLDFHATLENVADLCVPALADCCMIHLAELDENGTYRMVTVSHRDPALEETVREVHRRFPLDPKSGIGFAYTMNTGRMMLAQRIDEQALRAAATGGPEHEAMLRSLGYSSGLAVPLLVRGQIIGTLSLLLCRQGSVFLPADVSLAGELASRAAAAIDNARLYREAQAEIAERRRAQEALRESNERLSLAFAATQMGHWRWDAASDLITLSDRAAQIVGVPPGAPVRWEEIRRSFRQEDVVRAQEAGAKALRDGGGSYDIEFRMERAGQVHWISGAARPETDASGRLTGMTGVVRDITRRRNMEEDLRESERSFRELADALPHIVWTGGADGTTDYYNRRWQEYTGEAPGEGLWKSLLHPDDRERAIASWNEALRTGKPYQIQYRLRSRAGDYRWFLSRALPVHDASGNVARWFGTNTDVHDQRRSQEEAAKLNIDLRRRVEELETLLSVLPVGVGIAQDPLCDAISTNPFFAELLGIAPGANCSPSGSEAPSLPFRMLRDGRPLQAPELPLHAAALTGEPVLGLELQLERDARPVIDLLCNAAPVFDERGKVRGALGAFMDVSSFKRAQAEVRRLNRDLEDKVTERTAELERAQARDRANLERLKNIIDSMPLGALVTDEDRAVLHVNAELCRIVGMDAAPSLLLGTDASAIADRITRASRNPEDTAARVDRLQQERVSRLGLDVEMADGRVLCCDYLPVYAQGVHRGTLFLLRDVTKERRIDATKSEFMSLASHQLRTPLTALRWMLGRLAARRADADDDEAKLLRDGKAAAVRMSETIDTMLQISRIESGEAKPQRADIPLRALLERILEQYARDAEAKRQRRRLDCPADVRLHTDPHFLEEILSNLIGNAFKYTPEGGRIAVRAARTGGAVRIAVEDTGYGIPLHQQPWIFRKFFRGDNVAALDTAGTGLGLYLAYLLTNLLDGRISFVSTEGQGTTFTLEFPLPQA